MIERGMAMISKGKTKGTVRFAFKPARGGKKVELAGEFNNWMPSTMRKQKDGRFVSNIKLPPGTYEYKFIVDGQWIVDPDNGARALSTVGTINSVAQVD